VTIRAGEMEGHIMQTHYSDEYRVSARVVLRPGDRFRVSAGPYWRGSDGQRIGMAERGVMTFVRAVHRGAVVLIEARSAAGCCVLHVAGRRRNRVDPALVCRPYRIKGRVRATGRATA
jgi:hypothetical protein